MITLDDIRAARVLLDGIADFNALHSVMSMRQHWRRRRNVY